MLSGEFGMLVHRVGADADDLGPGIGEDLMAVPEGARLGRAAAPCLSTSFRRLREKDDLAHDGAVDEHLERLRGLGQWQPRRDLGS